MNKRAVLVIVIVTCLLIGCTMFSKSSTKSSEVYTATITNESSPTVTPIIPADKIEVVNFFGTQRCVSCLTIGKFTKKTLEEKFAPELESGKIVFKEINGELPENQAIVMKYQARGSSLFVNTIRGNTDDISEDVTVWRLVNSETQFVNYFEGKLKALLGK